MKKLNNVVLVLAKFFEIAHWIVVAIESIFLLLSILYPEAFLHDTNNILQLRFNGFTTVYDLTKGGFQAVAITAFFISAIPMTILTAMVYRNIYLICKTTKSLSSEAGETIFQKDITRMVRDIGIFLISSNLIGLVASFIIRLLFGATALEISMGFNSLFIGLIILYLSYVFNYGNKLENEVDGLL